jgi:hypothetical protein
MNEQAITAAITALRGQPAPRRDGYAAGASSPSNRTLAQQQTHNAKRFMAPVDRGSDILSPWPSRPRFTRANGEAAHDLRALGRHPVIVAFAMLFLAAGVLSGVARLKSESSTVIVHWVWPV